MPVSGKPTKKAIKKSQQQDSVKAKRPYVRKAKTEPVKAKRKYTKKVKEEPTPVKQKKKVKIPDTSFKKRFDNFMKPNGLAVKFVNELNNLVIDFNKFMGR